MKLNKILRLLALLLISAPGAFAQQMPISSHNNINPYTLNPAFAGAFNYKELYLNYRRDWRSIMGSPQTLNLSGNTYLYDNMWIGAEIIMDKADIFNRFKAGLSYTYRLPIAHNQALSFGISANLFQSSIRLDNVNADLNDPLLKNKDRLVNTAGNAGFGLAYNNKNLHIGFGVPLAFRTKDAYLNKSSGGFAFERSLNFHVRSLIHLNNLWKLRPSFSLHKTINQPIITDYAALFIYDEAYWLGGMYRSSGLISLNAGGQIGKGILLNYSYEIGLGGINVGSGGSHEITIGYQIENNNPKTIRKNSYQKKTYTKQSGYNKKREKTPTIKAKQVKSNFQKEKPPKQKYKRYTGKLPQYAPYEKF